MMTLKLPLQIPSQDDAILCKDYQWVLKPVCERNFIMARAYWHMALTNNLNTPKVKGHDVFPDLIYLYVDI